MTITAASLTLVLILVADTSLADTVVPARPIRAQSIIAEADLTVRAGDLPNGFQSTAAVAGQEARVVLYPGRPILIGDIGPPAIVARNQIVQMRYEKNGLHIVTEGRALDRGAVGDRLRIMNLSSRATLVGRVMQDGTIKVSQ